MSTLRLCHGGQMPTDITQLHGEILENPASQELDVERMLMGFLRALLDEQKLSGVFPESSTLPASESEASK